MKKPALSLGPLKEKLFGPIRDKLSGLKPPQQALLLIATFVLIGGGFYYFVYQEQVSQIQKTRTSIAEREKRLVELKNAAKQVDKLQAELVKAEEDFQQLLTFLPDQKEIPTLLESVSQLGAQVGLENVLFQPQPEQAEEYYAAIPVKIEVLGTYHEVGIFLDSLSKMHRILKVDNLSLIKRPGNPRLQVGCTLVTYRFVDKPETGKASDKGKGKGKEKKK